MRYLGPVVVIAGLFSLGGCGTKECRPGTLLLSVSVSGAAANATTLQVQVTVAGVGTHTSTVSLNGRADGTIQVDFPKYPAGDSATVTVTASSGTTPLGSKTVSTILSPGCDVLKVSIGTGVSDSPDMQSVLGDGATAGQDLGGQDLAGLGVRLSQG